MIDGQLNAIEPLKLRFSPCSILYLGPMDIRYSLLLLWQELQELGRRRMGLPAARKPRLRGRAGSWTMAWCMSPMTPCGCSRTRAGSFCPSQPLTLLWTNFTPR